MLNSKIKTNTPHVLRAQRLELHEGMGQKIHWTAGNCAILAIEIFIKQHFFVEASTIKDYYLDY